MDRYDKLWFGAVIGVLTSIISLIVFYFIKYEYSSFGEYVRIILHNKSLLAPLLSLAGIPNLVIFFIFLNRNKYRSARGVILATFILVIAVGLIKLFG